MKTEMKQGNLFLTINYRYMYMWKKKILLHISQYNGQLNIEISLS